MAVSSCPRSNLLIGESYGVILNQSMQHLLAEIHKKTLNSSHFIDIFYQLMQSKADPPMEAIWVYSALSFRTLKTKKSDDLSSRIVISKELFQLISGCSGPCSASKSIALLAPLVLQVYNLVFELLGKDIGAKRMKKAAKEVRLFIGAVLGYTTICCSKGMGEQCDSNLVLSFSDLVSVWMDGNEGVKSFLPLVSDDMCGEISNGGSTVGCLAGIVISEIFLLKLCMDLRVGNRGMELERELRSWIVGSITGFQSFYFFETLVRMLLEPTLPVASLLSSEDESFLRTILYDAATLVDYSFLCPERATNLPADHVRSLAVKRLIIAHEAIEQFRKNRDQRRAILYSSSFSNSKLPSQIIASVTSQIGMKEEASRLNRASPKALISWLLNLNGHGIQLFDDSISKFHAKLALDDFMSDRDQSASKPEGKKADVDLLFYIDNKGEEENHDEDDKEINESMSAAFIAAAQTIGLTENGGRKRKVGNTAGKKKKIKVHKYHLSDVSNSDEQRSSSGADGGSGSESEVENPISHEDVRIEEH